MNNRKELAMFFANEMIQLGLKPDRLTYDRLILVCLQVDDLEDALLYYEEMRSLRRNPGAAEIMRPRKGTWEELIIRCAKVGDDRAVAMLKEYKQWQEEPRIAVERVVKERFVEGIVPRDSTEAAVPALQTEL
jgi:pentatricopeptide repeat protein